MGAAGLVACFGIVAWRGLRAARRAPGRLRRLSRGGRDGDDRRPGGDQPLASSSRLVPTKGIPLPFVSYGGSSLVASWIAGGLILNISQHEVRGNRMSELGAYVIAAGGTGGHIVPGIALAHEIRAQKHGALVVFVGTASRPREQARPAGGLPARARGCGGFRRKDDRPPDRRARQGPEGVPRGPRAAQEVPGARRHRRRAVTSTVPVLTAARSLGIPTLIHESNAIPGLSNRFLNSLRDATAVGLRRCQRLLQEARVGHRHARALGVLRDPAARPGGDDAAPPRLRRQPGLARHEPRRWPAPGCSSRSPASKSSTRPGEKDLVATRQRYPRVPANWKLVPFLPEALGGDGLGGPRGLPRRARMTVAELSAAGRPSILVPFGRRRGPSARQRESALSEGRGRAHGGAQPHGREPRRSDHGEARGPRAARPMGLKAKALGEARRREGARQAGVRAERGE